MFSVSILISDSEIDPDYQHVHHTIVLSLMEKGRISFLESAGLSQKSLFERDLWAVISEIHIEYFQELKRGSYSVTCDQIRIERRRMVFEQRVLDTQGQEIAQASIKIMWFSKKAARSVTPPNDVIDAIRHFSSIAQGNS